MYLSRLQANNFRCFGNEDDGAALDMTFRPGLNVLVGENDGGKTAIVDAIRYVVSTRAGEFIRCTEDDFHVATSGESTDQFGLVCTFDGLTPAEEARFVEWLEFLEEGSGRLTLCVKCRAKNSAGKRRARGPVLEHSTGVDGTGPALDADARDYLLSTYLKPLRDAETEMSGGRFSRLSQILAAHPTIESQDANDNKSLLAIFRDAEEEVNSAPVLAAIRDSLNTDYLSKLSFTSDALFSELGIGKKADLRQVLDKLELWLSKPGPKDQRTRHGLGYSNVLFMAAELLLLGVEKDAAPLLLIEEPEAHIHPQLQALVMAFLRERCTDDSTVGVQAIVTTHSPNLACSAPVESLIVISGARAYPLAKGCTKLSPADYDYLSRFLDATKSSMFFARGVLIVEGDAENLLLPALARAIDAPLERSGVVIVNVGSRGLFRFANAFRRADKTAMPIRVACLQDRDAPPDWTRTSSDTAIEDDEPCETEGPELSSADSVESETDENVIEKVSPFWTFEYDLAMSGLAREVYLATREAAYREDHPDVSDELRRKWNEAWEKSMETNPDIADQARCAFIRLYKKTASKAITAQCLAEMIAGDKNRAVEDWRRVIPPYITEAIDFVTRRPRCVDNGTNVAE